MALTAAQLAHQQATAKGILVKVFTKLYAALNAGDNLSDEECAKTAQAVEMIAKKFIKPALKSGIITCDDIAAIAKQVNPSDGGGAGAVIICKYCGVDVRIVY